GKAVEEIVLGAEQDRWPDDRRVRRGREDAGLAGRLGARVERGRTRIGAERRYVDHAGAGRGSGARNMRSAFGLHGPEALLATLEQDADEVDHHVGIAHSGLDGCRIAQVRLHRMDLPDAPEW